jgi:hypothetical protein
MLLFDIHVLIWLDEGNPGLGENAFQTIIESLSAGQRLRPIVFILKKTAAQWG